MAMNTAKIQSTFLSRKKQSLLKLILNLPGQQLKLASCNKPHAHTGHDHCSIKAQQLEAVYTGCVIVNVSIPFVLLSEVAQACGVCQKQNGASVFFWLRHIQCRQHHYFEWIKVSFDNVTFRCLCNHGVTVPVSIHFHYMEQLPEHF